MAITWIQSTQGISGAGVTSFAGAYGTNTTANSYLLALGLVSGLTAVTMTATDTLGNTWTQIGSNMTDTINQYALFQVPKNVAAGANTVTLHSTVSSTLAMVIVEYTGQVQAGAPLDTSTFFGSGNTGAVTIGPIAGNQTNEEYIGIAWVNSAAAVVPNSGYTTRDATAQHIIIDQAFSGTGSRTGGWTFTASSVAAWLLSVKSTTSAAPATTTNWVSGYRSFVNKRGSGKLR